MSAADLLPREILESEQEGDWVLHSALCLERAARQLDLEDWIVQRLKHPEREMTVNLVIDSGRGGVVTGFRVQHSRARGLAMGPVMLSPECHIGRLRTLAAAETWQWALLDIPLGGSAGALVCAPREFSERELRQLLMDYVFALGDVIGPSKDVLTTGDCNHRMMAWIYDAFATAHGGAIGAIAANPAALGGLPWTTTLAGLGVVVLASEALARFKRNLAGSRIAIQGFGAAGASAATLLAEAGAHVIALADASGGLLREPGLHVPAVHAYVRQHRVLFGYPEADPVSNAEVLEARCDVLISAAAENQIAMRNADRIRAAVVIEAAHGAISEAAEALLLSGGKIVVPDLLGCAGPELAAYLEWRQSTYHAGRERTEAEQFMRRRLAAGFKTVAQSAEERRVSLRQACYLLALERVGSALRLR